MSTTESTADKQILVPLELTVKRTVDPQEVDDFMGLDWSRSVAWWLRDHTVHLDEQRVTCVYEDGNGRTHRKKVAFESILRAVEKATENGELCCAKDMAEDELGMGCAQDHDIVMQYVLLGELVFG